MDEQKHSGLWEATIPPEASQRLLPSKVDLPTWETFLSLVETGSMNQTATLLGCHPSTVSRRMVKLEAQLGVQLFEREQNQTRPSPKAREFYTVLVPVKRLYTQHLEDAIRSITAQEHPRIRLATVAGLIPFVLAVLGPFMRAHPRLNVDMVQTSRPREATLDGIDLALWADHEVRPDMVVQDLGVVPSVLCASSHYAFTLPKALHQLSEHIVVQSRGWVCPLEVHERHSLSTVAFHPKALLTVETIASLKEAVLAGTGIGMALPLYAVANEIKDGRLQVVLPGFRGPTLRYRLLRRRTPYPQPIVEALSAALAEAWYAQMDFRAWG